MKTIKFSMKLFQGFSVLIDFDRFFLLTRTFFFSKQTKPTPKYREALNDDLSLS